MTRPDRAAPPGAALTRTTTAWVRPCLAAPALALLLGGCIAVGPDYRRPEAPVSADWKQAGLWKPATPQDLSRNDAWWTVFGDPRLDTLIAAIEPEHPRRGSAVPAGAGADHPGARRPVPDAHGQRAGHAQPVAGDDQPAHRHHHRGR
jgi:hypothetical protein